MIILIKNLEARGIEIDGATIDPDEYVTVDLTVGSEFQVAGRADWHKFTGKYILPPSRCILVKTKERVVLPEKIFGVLCSKGSLSARGLIISNTKVDPLFGDYLHIPLFNAGENPVEVMAGMKFCSIYFTELEQPVSSIVHRKAIFQQITKRRVFRDFFMTNSGTIIASISSAVVGALITVGLTAYISSKSRGGVPKDDSKIQMQQSFPGSKPATSDSKPDNGDSTKSTQ